MHKYNLTLVEHNTMDNLFCYSYISLKHLGFLNLYIFCKFNAFLHILNIACLYAMPLKASPRRILTYCYAFR